jgi:hypothetical protein
MNYATVILTNNIYTSNENDMYYNYHLKVIQNKRVVLNDEKKNIPAIIPQKYIVSFKIYHNFQNNLCKNQN